MSNRRAYTFSNPAKTNKDIWNSGLTLGTHFSHCLMELGQGPGSVKAFNSLVETHTVLQKSKSVGRIPYLRKSEKV